MTDKQTFRIERRNDRWQDVARRAIAAVKEAALSGRDFQVVIGEVKRTLDQNAAMWPALTDFERQVDWPHTVKGQWVIGKMPKEAWKAVLTAAFEQQTETAQAIGGGVVMVGARTSAYGKRKMSDFLDFVRAEGNERGVQWSEKARDTFDEYIVPRKAA